MKAYIAVSLIVLLMAQASAAKVRCFKHQKYVHYTSLKLRRMLRKQTPGCFLNTSFPPPLCSRTAQAAACLVAPRTIASSAKLDAPLGRYLRPWVRRFSGPLLMRAVASMKELGRWPAVLGTLPAVLVTLPAPPPTLLHPPLTRPPPHLQY